MPDAAEEARVDELWNEWTTRRSFHARQRLICHYLPLVEFLASRSGRRVERSLRPDLFSFAAMGLIDAIERFRPEFGVRFETYGSRRISGALADGIRSLGWLPRGASRRAGRMIEAVVPVDFQTARMDSGRPIHDSVFERVEQGAVEALELEADHAEVVDAVTELPERERFVVWQHYFRRRPLKPIARDMGVTESRVCQLHRRALRMLEATLLARRPV